MDGFDENAHLLPPKKPKKTAVWVATGAIVVAAGIGMYAWKLRAAGIAARDKVDALQTERDSLADALELHRTSSVDLGGQLTVCKEQLTSEKQSFADADKARGDLDAELTACKTSVKDLKQQGAEAEKLLAEFKAVTRSFQKMIDSGKLEVRFRRGQMVVKLPEAILFPSGSADLSADGKQAIAEVAAILRKMPRSRFTVAGHTDNVPVGPGPFENNWELSAARAVTVTELLIAKGVPAGNLVAAGYGEYDPIASNGSATGRKKNRRIEIILEPNLKDVPEVAAKKAPVKPKKPVAKKK